jgi:NADH:ubiquinone oxidoreductase subunit 6 (subunit J)
MMEMLYYTIAAVLLYMVSDWILNRIEMRRGERFENRSLIFFVIILILATGAFNLIQYLQPAAAPAPAAEVQTEAEAVGSQQ